MSSPRHEFPVRASKDIYVGAVMALRADEVEMPGGRVAVRETLEHPGAVAIAALDDDDRLMVIHQYRHPVGPAAVGAARRPARRRRRGPARDRQA